ncbi:MAG TPA: substrate-binding domain-containing protein [Armatimonadota bacterium]
MNRPFLWVIPYTFVVLVMLSGTYAQQPKPLTGTLSLSGAWAIYPLAVKWGEAFHKRYPQVKLEISAGGAGKGMTDALSGAVDIGMVSREVDKAEKAKGAFPVFIAKDAVFATASTKNPSLRELQAKGLSLKTFADIFITTRVTTWRQAIGGPDAPIHLYTRADACGAASAWAATLGKYKQDDLRGIGVYGDPGLLEAVRRDPLGLGYNNLGFVFTGDQVTPGIVLVPVDTNHNGRVDPAERIDTREKAYQEIASGRYPGARREFFVTKGQPKGLAKAFIEFALSDEGTKVLKDVGGYVPLADNEQAEQVQRF